MAIFRCDMCGGEFEINRDSTVVTCRYCGSTHTLLSPDNDQSAKLADGASYFRRAQFTSLDKEPPVVNLSQNSDPLLRRAFMFLEDEEWSKADEYCEKVLDMAPECGKAYLGKLMAQLKVKNIESLRDCAQPFDNINLYQKALRFGDDQLKSSLKEAIDYIIDRNEKAQEKADELARQEAAFKAKRNKEVALFFVIACSVIAALIILITMVIDPAINYNQAVDLMNSGEYEQAIAAFKAMDGYRDSIDKIEECYIGIYGEDLWEEIKSINVGDVYKFGAYEQDNNIANGQEDIEWLVLEKDVSRILVISKYALNFEAYHTGFDDPTWEYCSLRQWLNNDFANVAFSAGELARIPEMMVSADKNPYYSTNSGGSTRDRIFLLSFDEAEKYFSSNEARKCEPTRYAVANGADKESCWWLRTPGSSQGLAACVHSDGYVVASGLTPSFVPDAVRPAMWIDLGA